MAEVKRLNYFNSQFLVEKDFQDEQAYHREMRLRHNRLLHAWGIADGLLVNKSGDKAVAISPGMAIDKDGREIMLPSDPAPAPIDLSTFGSNKDVYVTIAYDQIFLDADRYKSGTIDNFIRTTERPKLAATTTTPPTDGSVVVLAKVRLDGSGNVGTIDISVRKLAGGLISDDLTVRSLTLKNDNVQPSKWPKLTCSQDNLADLAGSLRVTGNGSVGGNVGIGTISPQAQLHVDHVTDGHVLIRSFPPNDTTPSLTRLRLTNRSAGGNTIDWALFTAAVGGGFGVNPNAFEIWEYPKTTPRLIILPGGNTGNTILAPPSGNPPIGGNVGIGITPEQKLDVNGAIAIRGSRTYCLGVDGSNLHWIMAGGTKEGTDNAIGLDVKGKRFTVGTGWTKAFLISHPLDPKNKNLIHTTLEGPEVGVYYRGEGQLSKGIATIQLPNYFEALTRKKNRTILLTPKLEGNFPVSMLAASEVKDGSFTVRMIDDKNPSQKFYWEVKAVRADVKELEAEEMKMPTN